MESLFDISLLRRSIESNHEPLAVWGAYHMLKLEDDILRQDLSRFLNSSFSNIREAGIAKIGEIEAEEYSPELIRIFREAEGQLKYASAYALAQFPNDFSCNLIRNWFESLIASEHTTRLELDAATYAFLKINRVEHFQKVVEALKFSEGDVIKSSILFVALLPFCEEEREFEQVLDQYFILRDIFSDSALTYQILETFGKVELEQWLTENLSRGYSISLIFEQCFSLLGYEITLQDRHQWAALESNFNSVEEIHFQPPGNPIEFLNALDNWVDSLIERGDSSRQILKLRWILNGFLNNGNHYLKSIPKIIDMESKFLLSIPLYIIQEQSIDQWLKKPDQHLQPIANYYHSSLLLNEYREQILSLFFQDHPKWSEEELRFNVDQTEKSQGISRHEILWSLYRGELLGMDIPWPSIFPNPNYSAFLSETLFQIYYTNFSYYIQKNDLVAIEYALQLFQLRMESKIIELLETNFDYLINKHNESLFQTLECYPDQRFIDLLLSKFHPDEFELAELVALICQIFDQPVPKQIRDSLQSLENGKRGQSGLRKRIRLHCLACQNTFQYLVETIFIDEAAIHRSKRLSAESVWVENQFQCKQCSSELPFHLDDRQLDELSIQSLVDRLLKITTRTPGNSLGQRVILFDFPRYKAETYRPDLFNSLVSMAEADGITTKGELQFLWMKQARMFKSMENWQLCNEVLMKIDPTASVELEWNFLMGLSQYKTGNFAHSRQYFDWIVKKYPKETRRSPFGPFIEQARNYISILDSDDKKKGRLKLLD